MVTTETKEFKLFMDKVNEMFANHSKGFPYPLTLDFKDGKKYIKLISVCPQRSAYGFIDKTNGDVLKAASWAAPAKHARSNIFNPDNGISCCGPYGIAHLR